MANRCVNLGACLLASTVLVGCAVKPIPEKQDRFCRSIMKPRRDVCVIGPMPTAAAAAQAIGLPGEPKVLTVYVLRNNFADPTELVRLEADGKFLTDTLPRTLVRLRLEPGAHVMSVGWRSSMAPHAVQGAAGEVRYLQLTGWAFLRNREFNLKEIDRARAMDLVRDTAFVADLVSSKASQSAEISSGP